MTDQNVPIGLRLGQTSLQKSSERDGKLAHNRMHILALERRKMRRFKNKSGDERNVRRNRGYRR